MQGESEKDMKNYTKIDERHTEYGLFELWVHNTKGETVPCIVTLNDYILCGTYDTLDTVVESYRGGDDFFN